MVVAAAVVAVMSIKLSPPEQVSSPTAAERLRAGFILVLGGMLVVLKKAVLPHCLLAMGLLFVTAYAVYHQVSGWPGPWNWLVTLWVVGFGSVLAMGYAFFGALFYSLKQAAIYAEDFFYELFEALKSKVRARIDTLEEGIAKQQAKVILDNSVREVLSPLKQLRVGSVPKALLAVLVGVLTFVSRSVFLARVARTAGTTVKFSRIFASRATLVGALFLNMRWLAALLLWVMYGLGIFIFALDMCWVL